MRWFTSDTHFDHWGVIKMCKRPWKDTRNMNAALIANWNAVVAPGDTVYHLGDFGFGSKKVHRDIFKQLNGRKHLIIGNHDDRGVRGLPWTSKQESLILMSEGLEIIMSHKPYPEMDRANPGRVYLHGHLHQPFRGTGNVIDVGVDANSYQPVGLDFIHRLAEEHERGIVNLKELIQ